MNVHFELFLDQKNTEIAEKKVLEKKFKLITTVGTTNMYLFDKTGLNIRKYETPEESEYLLDICCKRFSYTPRSYGDCTYFCSSRRVLSPAPWVLWEKKGILCTVDFFLYFTANYFLTVSWFVHFTRQQWNNQVFYAERSTGTSRPCLVEGHQQIKVHPWCQKWWYQNWQEAK